MTTEAEINAMPLNAVVRALHEALNAHRVRHNDEGFAVSLCNSFDRKGTLSTSQAYWARRLLLKVATPSAPAQAYGTYPTIAAEFQRLFDQGKKLPKLMFRVEGSYESQFHSPPKTVTVKKFGKITPNKKREVLYITIDGGWYATLRMDGTLLKARGVKEDWPMWRFMLAELAILNRDPHGYAKRFAETGRCCYCGSGLEDEPSVEAGYGPTCAKTWSRPWGGKTAEQRASKKARTTASRLDGDADQTYW